MVERLKQLRHARGLSQAALAKKAGLTREFLARLELGQHDPSLTTVQRLAKALRHKVSDLVE